MGTKNQYERILFGLKVKNLRVERGMSFSELSKTSKMSVSYLNEIEKGKKFPKPEKLRSLAEALSVEVPDLVSLEPNAALMPVAELLKSDFLSELPLNLFGIELQKVVEMIANAPKRVGAFISTLVELSKNYALQEENFYFGAMRAYQEMHFNYFKELELKADELMKQHKLKRGKVGSGDLEAVLSREYGILVDDEELSAHPELNSLLSLYLPEKKILLVRAGLDERLKTLTLGREVAYQFLQLRDRSYFTPLRNPRSFDPVLNHFKVTYFSGALVMHREDVAKGVEDFCNRETWDEKAFLEIMDSFNITPELYFHRLTQIMPHSFKLNQLFFIRVRTEPLTYKYAIDKVLHLNQSHHAVSNKIAEHYCRRWNSVQILSELQELRKKGKTRTTARAQMIRYHGTEDDYLVISVAIPAKSIKEKDISVTFGILMTESVKRTVKFAADPKIAFKEVGKTCERCPITDCKERATPPSVLERKTAWQATEDKMREMLGA